MLALKDADGDVRSQVAWALGELEDDARCRFWCAPSRDKEARVRSQAAWALGEIEDPAAAVEGLAAVLTDSDAEVNIRPPGPWERSKTRAAPGRSGPA